MANDTLRQLRALLILGRVSNLPTVWSNCLAGWWLGGGGNVSRLPFLICGVTCLYLGGMFLNDAFDAGFDSNHRRSRPIPSGAISRRAVWRWGWAWLLAGATLLFLIGMTPGVLGLVLVLCIIAYDAIHKIVTPSLGLMGLCRFFVYVLAAATGVDGVSGWAIWCGLALGFYVVGLSLLARNESTGRPVPRWPPVLLGTPILLALLINAGTYRESAMLLSLVLALWLVRCLRTTYWTASPHVSRTVSGLLAGIVFVDWLAAVQAPRELSFAFLALFGCAVLGQKLVPAT